MEEFEKLYHIQEEIASKAIIKDEISLDEIKLIGGADQAFFRKKGEERIISCVVTLEYPSLKLVGYSYAVMPVNFPYIPGLLSFREAPSIIEAFKKLKRKPDVLVVDGCGINHPRFAGLATHIGVTLDVVTIGVAKNILCGDGEVPTKEGEEKVIRYKGRNVGYYFKSKRNCKPIIIAPGHKISLHSSLMLIKNCIRDHKLPEPSRIAHLYANKIKKLFKEQPP
ncbi:MAG: endonuclease V [Candidatus Methanospirareceae archaeon]